MIEVTPDFENADKPMPSFCVEKIDQLARTTTLVAETEKNILSAMYALMGMVGTILCQLVLQGEWTLGIAIGGWKREKLPPK